MIQEGLPSISSRPLTVLGLMSGTSVDSVDACLTKLWLDQGRFQYEVLATYTQPMPDALGSRLLACMGENQTVALSEICQLNVLVGELFAETVFGLLRQEALSAEAVDLIGSHGQTLYHLPPTGDTLHQGSSLHGSTLQIGEPSVIADFTGIHTVADFRPRDMASGGQGAPLVCFADRLLFQTEGIARCIQNIGGIANVTVVPPLGFDKPVIGFDTGPGNMLMDGAMMHLYQQPYDDAGKIAASGAVCQPLLATLLTDPYFSAQPPKTTGRERFGKDFLHRILKEHSTVAPADMMATLTAFTAKTIVDAYLQFVLPTYPAREMILGGGGLLNQTLVNFLQVNFQEAGVSIEIKGHEAYGIPSKYKEALAFAILAWATWEGIPNNVPACTGATHPVILGKILPGRKALRMA